MSVNLSPVYVDAQLISGIPAVGAKLFTYVAGSTTKLPSFTDSAGSVAHANPIILNSRGEPANGGGTSMPIFLTAGQTYDFVFAPSTDTDPPSAPIRTISGVKGVNDTTSTADQWIASNITPTYISATQFTLPGDQTSNFQQYRRLKFTVTAGTVYGYIVTSTFAVLTTVTVAIDSGALDSGLSAVSYGLLTPLNDSIPEKITLSGLLTQGAATNIASAATVDLTVATGNTVDITGTVATSALTMTAGQQMVLIAQGAWPLTYNATTMNINGGVSYTCAAGDRIYVAKDLASVIQASVIKADGTPVVSNTSSITKADTSIVLTDTGANGTETVTIDGVVAEVRNATGKTSYVRGTQGGNSDTALPEYQCRAWVNFDGTSAGTFAGGASTVTRIAASTLCTVTTATPHGLTTGNTIWALTGVVAGLYVITNTGSTTFTFTTVATTALSAVAITFDFRTIRASGNVNSVAHNGTGDYFINLTSLTPDANYSINVTATRTANTLVGAVELATSPTTASFRIRVATSDANVVTDSSIINVTVFR